MCHLTLCDTTVTESTKRSQLITGKHWQAEAGPRIFRPRTLPCVSAVYRWRSY